MNIKIVNLSKSFEHDSVVVEAVKPCSFEIKSGEQVVITGTSGSGKSTLLNLLGGLEKATKGNVIYNGKDITKIPQSECDSFRLKHIGFVFQSYNLIPELTAYENIILPIMLQNRKIDKPYIQKLITQLDLTERVEHLPGQLSGGQQQRVSLARALANGPDCLLCDEPTGNLDKKNTDVVMNLIFEMAREFSITLLMVTHDENIAKLFPRKITINDGVAGGDI